jgi:hypothetical protein
MGGVGSGWELPPGAEPWSDFHWFQSSTKGVLVLVLLSRSPVWYTGHFNGGRMAPCYNEGCEYCKAGIGSQVRYCFGVVDEVTRRPGLIELGKGNGELLRDWAYRSGGLRGLTVEISKHSRAQQSRTLVQYVDRPSPVWVETIDCPDVALALYLTWHKAGFKMPESFQREMMVRHLSLHNRVG